MVPIGLPLWDGKRSLRLTSDTSESGQKAKRPVASEMCLSTGEEQTSTGRCRIRYFWSNPGDLPIFTRIGASHIPAVNPSDDLGAAEAEAFVWCFDRYLVTEIFQPF